MAHDLESSDYPKCVLLVPELLQTKLLCIGERLEQSLGRPLEIKLLRLVIVSFKHRQASDRIFQLLKMRTTLHSGTIAVSNLLELLLRGRNWLTWP